MGGRNSRTSGWRHRVAPVRHWSDRVIPPAPDDLVAEQLDNLAPPTLWGMGLVKSVAVTDLLDCDDQTDHRYR